jgi:hypothetical protein
VRVIRDFFFFHVEMLYYHLLYASHYVRHIFSLYGTGRFRLLHWLVWG